MATSDSEEFESADEDLDLNVNKMKLEDTLTSEKDVSKFDKGIENISDNKGKCETSLQESFVLEQESVVSFTLEDSLEKERMRLEGERDPVGDHTASSQIENLSNVGGGDVEKIADNKVKKDKKIPQRTRETKKTGVKKKLGTKITAESVKCHKSDNSEIVSVNTDIHDSGNDKNHSAENVSGSQYLPSRQEININEKEKSETVYSKNAHTELGSVLDKLSGSSVQKEDSAWGGWGSWGVTSLLSTATEGVSTLTSHVSQGLSTVLETGIGIPDPEELARLDREREIQQAKDVHLLSDSSSDSKEVEEPGTQTQDEVSFFGLSHVISGVSSITKLVETTGSKVITGGLDTLETIGKKTMEVLQEGDPGLKKKRELFSDKIILSQVLREAKEKAELEDKLEADKEALRKAHFETLFDDYQGLVHLEALEMLSKQCELKVEMVLQSLKGQVVIELQKRLNALKDQCDLPDEDDTCEEKDDISDEWFGSLNSSFSDLGVLVSTEKINATWEDVKQWLSTENKDTIPREIHQKAMATLARLTAESVELFHKTAELLLVKANRDPFQEAHCLQEITVLLSSLVNNMASRFSDLLNSCDKSLGTISVNDLITNIFFEASNSSSYLKEAFQLMAPVLQFGLLP